MLFKYANPYPYSSISLYRFLIGFVFETFELALHHTSIVEVDPGILLRI